MTDTPHLSDATLLRAIDGELPARDAADVSAHLEACWSCRAERDRIALLIGEIVEFRDRAFAGDATDAARPQFLARLRQRLDAEVPRDRARPFHWWAGARRSVWATWNGRLMVAAAILLVIWVTGATPSAAMNVIRDVVRWLSPPRVQSSAGPPDTRPANTISPTVVPHRSPVEPRAARARSPVVPARAVNLVDLELEAWWQLHRVGALAGEDVAIERTDRRLSIRVRVDDPRRKTMMQAALAPLTAAGAQVCVETFAELAASSAPAKGAPRVVYRELGATLDQSAASHKLAARVLAAARQLTLHAFALDRLQQRLPASVLAQASEPARVTYRVLVREYVSAVEARVQTLHDALQAALGPASGAPPPAADTASEAVAAAALRLEDEVRGAFGIHADGVEATPADAARLQMLLEAVRAALNGSRQRVAQ